MENSTRLFNLTSHGGGLNAFFVGCGIFLFSLCFFLIGLQHQEIIGFESRFYLFALEMMRHGITWFPTTYGNAYPDYPVTPTLVIVGVAKLFGHLSKLTAVLPTAIAAALAVTTTYYIGALRSPRWGFYAVCFLLLTNTFVMEARTLSPDQYITLVTALAFYLVYSADLYQTSRRLWLLPLLFIFGFACRGPIGLVVPAGVVCVFFLLNCQFKRFFAAGFVALFVLVIMSGLLLLLANNVGDTSFVQDVIRMQVAGRLQDADLPMYFYFVESMGAYALAYPVAILCVIGLLPYFKKQKSADLKFILQLLGWAAIIILGLSLAAGKKVRYVLAFAPALALISASLFVLPPANTYLSWLRKGVYSLCFVLPLLSLIAALLVAQHIKINLFFMVFLGVLQIGLLIKRPKSEWVIACAALTFLLSNIFIVEPMNQALNQTRDFVLHIEQERVQQNAMLVFYHEHEDAMPIKYVVNMPQEERPVFVTSAEDLLDLQYPAFIITDQQYFSELPDAVKKQLKVVTKGKVGHDTVVVFQKN